MDEFEKYVEKREITEAEFTEVTAELEKMSINTVSKLTKEVIMTAGVEGIVEYCEMFGYQKPDDSVNELEPEELADMMVEYGAMEAHGEKNIPDFPFLQYIRHMLIAKIFAMKIKSEIEINQLTS